MKWVCPSFGNDRIDSGFDPGVGDTFRIRVFFSLSMKFSSEPRWMKHSSSSSGNTCDRDGVLRDTKGSNFQR